jgi:hypothetical protein
MAAHLVIVMKRGFDQVEAEILTQRFDNSLTFYPTYPKKRYICNKDWDRTVQMINQRNIQEISNYKGMQSTVVDDTKEGCDMMIDYEPVIEILPEALIELEPPKSLQQYQLNPEYSQLILYRPISKANSENDAIAT